MLWQELEFGWPPDAPRLKGNPFRLRATFRLTIASCTPLAQHSPLVQMSAPIPLAADLNPNPDSSALHNSSTSEPMEPQPKRQCIDELAHASDAPLAAVEPPLVAADPPVPPAAEPLAEASVPEPVDERADVISPVGQYWNVYGNDPNDLSGIRSVLLAAHSRGKPEIMAKAAFPSLSIPEIATFVQMPAFNVFTNKGGNPKPQAPVDARRTCIDIIRLAEEHGLNLRIWGCGGGMDRMVQISDATTGFVDPTAMRPIQGREQPAEWDRLGIRKSPEWEHQRATFRGGQCTSVQLTEHSNGEGTYRAEVWRNDQCVTHFYLGVYPHPGSQSWGAVEGRPHEHAKFLRNLAAGTPSQARVIKFNADDFE